MTDKKVIITGAAGRLGTYVARAVQNGKHKIHATDLNFRRDPQKLVKINVADLSIRSEVYRELEGGQTLIHLANDPISVSVRDPLGSFQRNSLININVFQAARQLGFKRIIFASTGLVMSGDRGMDQINQPTQLTKLPIDGNAPVNPGSMYALGKANAEQMLQYFASHSDMSCISIRLPLLLDAPMLAHMRKQPLREAWAGMSVDDGFGMLSFEDASRLFEHCVRAKVEGYKCYHPAAIGNYLGLSGEDLVAKFYPSLEAPAGPIIDTTAIEKELGFTPVH